MTAAAGGASATRVLRSRSMSSGLKRTPDVIERTVADETFLLPVRGELARTVEMFALSEVGRFVWHRADGSRGLPELVAEVVREFEVGEEQARADVAAFVDQMRAYGLLTGEE
jgi:coenzyme PQQ synthesis protein D (PqqD)